MMQWRCDGRRWPGRGSAVCAALALALTLRVACVQADEVVELPLPLLPETYLGEQDDPSHTVLVAVLRTDGSARTVVLRPMADTSLWKGSDKPAGSGRAITLRDNRWSQGLFKIGLESLDKGAVIERASFRFKAGASERPGNAKLQFHRMLVDWSESATWNKPFPDRPDTWSGLRPGKDYEAEPFATQAIGEWKPGRTVEVAGFDKAVNAWRGGTWPNYGFVVLFWGKALQVTIPSREAAAAARAPVFTVGGPDDKTVVLHCNLPLLKRLLVAPEDLRQASLKLKLKGKPKAASTASLCFQRARAAGQGFEDTPALRVSLKQTGADGRLSVPGLEKLLGDAGNGQDLSLLVTVRGDERPAVQIYGTAAGAADRPALQVSVKAYSRRPLFDFDLRPLPGVFCTVKDGHFDYGGKRLRLWGTVGYGAADRKRRMGFNCDRLWGGPELYDEQSVKRGEPSAAVETAAREGQFDPVFAAVKQQGLFVMYAGLTSTIPFEKYRKPLLADDSFLAGGPDWEAWKEAVAGKFDQGRLTVLDERLTKLRLAHARNLLKHRNALTGKRLGEDEAIVVYEVSNELGFVRWVMEGGLDKAPGYFRDKARHQWNDWLKARYRNDAALQAAWGTVGGGESLVAGTVQLGPNLAQRNDYSEPRGRDYVRFSIEMLDTFNQRFREHCRTQAPRGVGVNVAPFSFDTQYRPSVPWAYTNCLGDVNCFGMYFWGIAEELARPPTRYVIDSHSVVGHPTVLYETNQARPSPYRSAYPLQVAALASWQDWDGVIFHYWGGLKGEGTPDERYLLEAMPHVNRSHFWAGVQHAFDPVMCSSMAIAGRMFLGRAVQPAPHPATFEAGARAIFGFDAYNGLALGQTAFARGAHIRFEPNKDAGVTVDGHEPPSPQRLSGAVLAGRQIAWDWPNGRLLIDTPTWKAYVGRTAGAYRFSDGIALSKVSVPWVCFAIASADGKPLTGPGASGRMHVAAVSDARNIGFEIDPAFRGGGPLETADAIRNRGTAPVIVDGVGYTVSFPTAITGRFEGYDFALRKVDDQAMSGIIRLVREPRELYMAVLMVERRGEAADVPQTTLAIATAVAAPERTTGAASEAAATDAWSSLPGLSWDLPPAEVHKLLRGSSLPFTSISQLEADKSDPVITLSDAKVLWNAPADVSLSFQDNRLRKVLFTFKQPPALGEAVADHERRFGKPLQKTITRQEEVSRVHWRVKQAGAVLDIVMTEAQGTLAIAYEYEAAKR